MERFSTVRAVRFPYHQNGAKTSIHFDRPLRSNDEQEKVRSIQVRTLSPFTSSLLLPGEVSAPCNMRYL